jgi:hypothetical protein
MTPCIRPATSSEGRPKKMNSFLKFLSTIKMHRKENTTKMLQPTSLESMRSHNTAEDRKETPSKSKQNKK